MPYLNAPESRSREAVLHWRDPMKNGGHSQPMGLSWARYLAGIYQREVTGRVCWVEDLREYPDDDQEEETA